MGFSTLAAAGFQTHGSLLPHQHQHPFGVRPMQETEPPAPCSESQRPAMPGDPSPVTPTMDRYLRAPPLSHSMGARLTDVRIEGGVWMHPSWAQTALWPALSAPVCTTSTGVTQVDPNPSAVLLDINAVTPDIVAALAPETRQSLMSILGSVPDLPISWQNTRESETYEREKILGMQIGHRYKVNGATGLALSMAQVPDHRPFCDAVAAGLTAVAGGLTGKGCSGLFSVCDTVEILAQVLQPLPTATPVNFRTNLDAASTLVQRYLEQHCTDSADSIRIAFEELLKGLAPFVARDADHVGLCIGVILAGVAKYGGDITLADNKKRWRVAAMVNMIWAASSFGPLFFIAGPWAVTDVGAGILWDRLNPVRDYGELLGHFETELSQLLLTSDVPGLGKASLSTLFMRIRQSFRAAGLPG